MIDATRVVGVTELPIILFFSWSALTQKQLGGGMAEGNLQLEMIQNSSELMASCFLYMCFWKKKLSEAVLYSADQR
jgi:hypothetical protein